MFGRLEVTRMAQALAAHAGSRQGVVAQNIAQADTPDYKAKDLPRFIDSYDAGMAIGLRATRPQHLTDAMPGSGPSPVQLPGAASPNGNTVSLEGEMVRSAEVRQQHDMALAVYRSVSDILRVSLGRSR